MKITKSKLKQLIRESLEEYGDAISTFFANNQPDDSNAYLVYELDVFANMIGEPPSFEAVDLAIDNASDPDVPRLIAIRDVEGINGREPHVFIKNRGNV